MRNRILFKLNSKIPHALRYCLKQFQQSVKFKIETWRVFSSLECPWNSCSFQLSTKIYSWKVKYIIAKNICIKVWFFLFFFQQQLNRVLLRKESDQFWSIRLEKSIWHWQRISKEFEFAFIHFNQKHFHTLEIFNVLRLYKYSLNQSSRTYYAKFYENRTRLG